MAKKKYKKPPRPRLRKLFPKRGPTWIKLEPARLAMVGGLFFTTCSMVFYLFRHLTGDAGPIEDILLGVAVTFFVSYTGTGFFVWYLLRTAERELDRPAATKTAQTVPEPAPETEPIPGPEAPPAEHQAPANTEEQP